MKYEAAIKVGVFAVAVLLLWPIAYGLTQCRDGLIRAISESRSHPAHLARFYFLVLMSLVIIMTQNIFIRASQRNLENKRATEAEDH